MARPHFVTQKLMDLSYCRTCYYFYISPQRMLQCNAGKACANNNHWRVGKLKKIKVPPNTGRPRKKPTTGELVACGVLRSPLKSMEDVGKQRYPDPEKAAQDVSKAVENIQPTPTKPVKLNTTVDLAELTTETATFHVAVPMKEVEDQCVPYLIKKLQEVERSCAQKRRSDNGLRKDKNS